MTTNFPQRTIEINFKTVNDEDQPGIEGIAQSFRYNVTGITKATNRCSKLSGIITYQ